MKTPKRSSINNSKWKPYDKLLVRSTAKNAKLIESKHQQIVEGASRRFVEKGFHPTTIREIAESCGMSMGQLYHYISSKDDILFLAHEHLQKMWYQHLEESGIEEIRDPMQLLVEALRHTLDFIFENKKLYLFVYTESKYLDKKYLNVVLQMDDENIVGFWRKLLKNINEKRGTKINIDFAANLIHYHMVFMALRGWNLKDMKTKDCHDLLIDFILRGLGIS